MCACGDRFEWTLVSAAICLSILLFVALSTLLVDRMPVRGRFSRPFGIAGDGARYLRINLVCMHGNILSWSFSMASTMVSMGKLKNWCMYFICCCLYGSMYTEFSA